MPAGSDPFETCEDIRMARPRSARWIAPFRSPVCGSGGCCHRIRSDRKDARRRRMRSARLSLGSRPDGPQARRGDRRTGSPGRPLRPQAHDPVRRQVSTGGAGARHHPLASGLPVRRAAQQPRCRVAGRRGTLRGLAEHGHVGGTCRCRRPWVAAGGRSDPRGGSEHSGARRRPAGRGRHPAGKHPFRRGYPGAFHSRGVHGGDGRRPAPPRRAGWKRFAYGDGCPPSGPAGRDGRPRYRCGRSSPIRS